MILPHKAIKNRVTPQWQILGESSSNGSQTEVNNSTSSTDSQSVDQSVHLH